MTLAAIALEPQLPAARGPLSMAVLELLAERVPRTHFVPVEAPLRDSDPYGVDMQLALHICYELHYRGFAGVDLGWEWNPALLHLRAQFENEFLAAVRNNVGTIDRDTNAADELAKTSNQNPKHPAHYLHAEGTWAQLQEYFIHRSLYRLRESDPQTWLVPRRCRCHASLHQQSFAMLMAKAGLDTTYLAYIDQLPAQSLAVGNLMSLFGLHRAHRGAAIGFLAAAETASSQISQLMLQTLQRVEAPASCVAFYRDYTESGAAAHEQSESRNTVDEVASREPSLNRDLIFGIKAYRALESRFTRHLVENWRAGRSSLRRPA